MSRRPPAIAVLLVLGALAAGCGPSGHGAETDPEKGSDAEILNAALGRELTALELYTEASRRLAPPRRPLARRLRSHEQEYVDAITKAIRGLGGDVEAEAETAESGRRQDEILKMAFQLESEAVGAYLEAAPRLYTSAPRTLAAALAAGHAQHLVALRRARGASPAASIPKGFDSGAEE